MAGFEFSSAASSGSSNASPAGTDWIVGYTDYTDNEVLSSTAQYWDGGPFIIEMAAGGTGVTSFQANSIIDDESFGIRDYVCASSAGGFLKMGTDSEAFKTGDGTIRMGARVKVEAIPVNGAEDYVFYMGFNSGTGNTLNSANYAVIGINLSDNATNWVVKCKDATTETVTDTGVAFSAVSSGFVNIEIEIAGSTRAVSAWINGTLVLDGSTTNVPATATNIQVNPIMTQRVGTPSLTRSFYYDWHYIAYKAGTARGSLGGGGPFA